MDSLTIVILSIIGVGFLNAAICGLLGINAPKEPEDETSNTSFSEETSVEEMIREEESGLIDHGMGHYGHG